MSEPTTPHQVRCVECNQPMRWRGARHHWEGDYQFADYSYECPDSCMTAAEVSYRTFIPVDVAKMQQC